MAFAHHPVCDRFHADVWRFGRLPVCRGCLLTWPGFFLATAVAGWLLLGGADPWALVAAGLTLGVPQGLGYLRRGGPVGRVCAKISGGLGLGTLVTSIFFLPLPWAARIGVIAGLWGVFIVLQVVRFRSIMRVCDTCVHRPDWGMCPGFRSP